MKRRKKQKTKKENEEEDKNKRKYAHVLPPHAKSSRNANDSRAPSCPAPPSMFLEGIVIIIQTRGLRYPNRGY